MVARNRFCAMCFFWNIVDERPWAASFYFCPQWQKLLIFEFYVLMAWHEFFSILCSESKTSVESRAQSDTRPVGYFFESENENDIQSFDFTIFIFNFFNLSKRNKWVLENVGALKL